MTNPYTETILEQHGTGLKFVVRKFSHDVSEEDLVWHRDTKNRTIHILEGSEWELQKEDKLPVSPLQRPVVTTCTFPFTWSNSPNLL